MTIRSDHPRSRGEYTGATRTGIRCAGSSSLSRGIHLGVRTSPSPPGIIPALAGNTITLKVRELWSPDHPRSRGEYTGAACQQHECRGSSPLSRGIRFPGDPGQGAFRIIPALAGNTHLPRSQSHRHPDHPRSRGEYVRRRAWSRGVRGSSPLSRGIPRNTARGVGCAGIIPALAGNTAAAHHGRAPPRDHPRSRGEYTARCFVLRTALGSSPLSRGIPVDANYCYNLARIIPALAGNTPPSTGGTRPRRDHPRSRGEYKLTIGSDSLAAGSSPLSRGIHDRITTGVS